ncbi:MAG TPA: sulfate ABC transporter permease subunit CysT [Gaiellaceae bacterium]
MSEGRRLASVAAPRLVSRGSAKSALPLGLTATFLSVVVGLPLAALIASAGHWNVVTSPECVAALKLTLAVAALAALANAVLGTLTAWVLVRDDFRGKSALNAVIDLPFALPTVVAGLLLLSFYGPQSPVGIHVAYTRTAIWFALLFVTLPFVVRTVQPVLIELDVEMEDAARSLGASRFTVFRRIVLPNILPGIFSGFTLAFARAVGEIGAIVLISGNLPYRTEVASVFIFNHLQSGDPSGAAAVAVCLLAISFTVLLVVGGVRRRATRHERDV